MTWILKIIASALSVMLLAYILPGISIDSFGTAIVVVFVLTFCNLIIKPVLIFFTLPITIVTLGLFLLVINVIIINITDFLITGFQVNGFINALVFSFLLSFMNSFSSKLIEKKEG
jgi:putative membrane protein